MAGSEAQRLSLIEAGAGALMSESFVFSVVDGYRYITTLSNWLKIGHMKYSS